MDTETLRVCNVMADVAFVMFRKCTESAHHVMNLDVAVLSVTAVQNCKMPLIAA